VEFRSGTEDAGRRLSLEGRSPAVAVFSYPTFACPISFVSSSHETHRASWLTAVRCKQC